MMRKNVFGSAAVAVLIVAAAACQTDVTMWSACTPAADGNPTGTDGQYVLVCKDGSWEPIMTVDEFVRSARGEDLTIAPLPQRPQAQGTVIEPEPTTTTTTLAPRTPTADVDRYSLAIGTSVTGNVLTNDDLGNPPGSVSLVLWVGGTAQPGTPADHGLGTLTLQADGSFVFQNTGVPAGTRIYYNYRLTNSVGTSTGVLEFTGA